MGIVSKIDGIAIANVAKIDGIALASIAKVNGETIETGLDQVANNYSMEFDGTNYIDIDPQVEWGPVSSISLWFKKDVSNFSGILLGGTNAYSYTLYVVDNKLYQFFSTTNSIYTGPTSGPNTLRTTDWVHIAVVRYTTTNPGDSVELYINGTSVYTNPAGIGAYATLSKVQRFGARTDGTNKFVGKMDEIALFDYALSASDVQDIYDATDTNLIADLSSMSTPPIAWYRMGD